MNVQFAGTLRYQLQLSEVLRRVMEGQPEPLSALLLNDEQNGRHGTICISQSRYICGAELKNGQFERISTGYEALKEIARLVSANFKYITAPPEFFENTELTLNIPIEKLLVCLPELPAEASELHDSDALLDRVFDSDEIPVIKPVEVPDPAASKPKKKSTWHSMPVRIAAEVFAQEEEDEPETEEEEEPKIRYTTMEERALMELGPPSGAKVRKKKPWYYKSLKRIGYFFYSLYTAPMHVIRNLAKPVILPLVAIAVLYQAWNILSPMVRNFKFAPPPSPKHQATVPDRPARSAPVYRAPVARRSAPAAHPADSDTITITQPVVENKPIVPYTTPVNPPVYPHRRAYQVVPQAHPSNANLTAPVIPASNTEPPNTVTSPAPTE